MGKRVPLDIETFPMVDIDYRELEERALRTMLESTPGTYSERDAEATLAMYKKAFPKASQSWVDELNKNPLEEACEELKMAEMRDRLAAYAKTKLGHQPRNRHERRKLKALERRNRCTAQRQ